MRVQEGFPIEGMGKSTQAKSWEEISDQAIYPKKAKVIQEAPEILAQIEQAKLERTKAENELNQKLIQHIRDKGLNLSPEQENNLVSGMTYDAKEQMVGDDTFSKAWAKERNLHSHDLDYNAKLLKENPIVNKLDPNTSIYSTQTGGLGFDHILDVLKENLANGRLKPEDLKNISVEQAVRKTADYDLELAKKMQEAQAKKLDEMTLHKEYPNGMKWVQLDQPGQFAAESQAMGHSVRGYEPPEGHPDWIPESGEEGSLYYGHGGWEGIKSGRAKIYSLVDPKGNPHTTIEVGSPMFNKVQTWGELSPEERTAMLWKMPSEGDKHLLQTYGDQMQIYHRPDGSIRLMPPKELLDPETVDKSILAPITQIKGKSNRAPNENYLPYIQDFVKSGNWSNVGDLKNTGLNKIGNQYLTTEELKPKVDEANNFLNTHPAFETHRQSGNASSQLLHPEVPYAFNEVKAVLNNPEEYDSDVLPSVLNSVDKLRQIHGNVPQAPIDLGAVSGAPPETPQLKRGGPVHMAGGGKFGALKTMIEEAPEMLPFLKGMFEKGEEGVHNMLKQVMGTPEVKPVKKGDVLVTDRVPALEQASQQIGKTITPEEYANLVEQHLPIRPLNFIPKPPTDEEAMNALNQAKRSKYGLAKDIQEGEKVGARLDIPAYTDKNTWVNSIHQEGKPTTYSTVSHIKNFTIPNFDEKALKVAQGGPKSPFAKMEGDWQHITPDQALDMAKELYSHPEWTQMGMDPRRAGHFYDRYTGQPIVGGEEALQIGPMVFGKNPVYAPKSDFAFRKGGDVHMAGGGSNDIPDIPYNDEPMFRVDPRAFIQRVGDNTFADTSVNIPMKNVDIGAGYNTMNTPTSQMNTPYLQASGDVNGTRLNARYMEPVPNVQRANIMANMPIGTGQLGVGVTNTKDPYQSRLTDAQLNYNIPLGGGRLNAGVNRNLPSKQNQVNLQYVHPFKRGGKVHMSNNPDSQWAELQFKRK
jgi:hypothetical protein